MAGRISHALVTLGVLLLAGPAGAEVPIWSDEFDGGPAPDPTVWTFDIGDGCAAGICGWGNQEFQIYTDAPANVRVEDGHLVITALREVINGPADPGEDEYAFTSARLKSQNRLAVLYGTIEARIQLPDLADGLWPAFWTLGIDIPSVGWPACGEIDIMEMGSAGAIADGAVNRRVGSHAHWDINGSYAGYGLFYTSPTDLTESFHVYRMEWTPSSISTFVDGTPVWTIDISNPAGFSGEEFHQPHFLIMNLAVGGTYTGITGSTGDVTAPFPAEYRVDWVRIYDNGHTSLLGLGAPIALDATLVGSDVELSFQTQAGLAYDVYYKTSRTDGSWTLLQSVEGDGTTMTVYDPVASPASFYRIEAYQ